MEDTKENSSSDWCISQFSNEENQIKFVEFIEDVQFNWYISNIPIIFSCLVHRIVDRFVFFIIIQCPAVPTYSPQKENWHQLGLPVAW